MAPQSAPNSGAEYRPRTRPGKQTARAGSLDQYAGMQNVGRTDAADGEVETYDQSPEVRAHLLERQRRRPSKSEANKQTRGKAGQEIALKEFHGQAL